MLNGFHFKKSVSKIQPAQCTVLILRIFLYCIFSQVFYPFFELHVALCSNVEGNVRDRKGSGNFLPGHHLFFFYSVLELFQHNKLGQEKLSAPA